jgi:GTP-binding protein EngB required for normal cell division
MASQLDDTMRTPMPRQRHFNDASECYFTDAPHAAEEENEAGAEFEDSALLSIASQVHVSDRPLSPRYAGHSEVGIGGSQVPMTLAQRLAGRAVSPSLPSSWASPASSNAADVPAAPNTAQVRVGTASSVSSIPASANMAPSTSYDQDPISDSTGPALVMPRMQRSTSSTRPVTEHGRRVGKLRVLFCGNNGSGKTTLLRTLVDQCPDVVLFEDIHGSEPGRPTTELNEVKASTQPYPAWKILQSSGHQARDAADVLERNLALVDTPGYGLSAEAEDAIEPILRYLDDQFQKTNRVLRDTIHLSDEDLANLIAAPQGGLTQVDVVVYCVSGTLTETDEAFMTRLATYATVLPVLTKSDLMNEEQLDQITKQLQAFSAHLYGTDRLIKVCCRDPEMDASVLMQSTYQAKLPSSDLPLFYSILLHGENPARFRHLAARKFICWKQGHDAQACASMTSCNREEEQVAISQSDQHCASGSLVPSAAFTVSRIAEHTRREASAHTELRIAAWASEMTQSLAAQRASTREVPVYTSGVNATEGQGVEAEWVLAKRRYLEETQAERSSSLLSWNKSGACNGRAGYVMTLPNHFSASATRDPLGLIEIQERLSRCAKKVGGWLVDLGVVSGVGFLCWTWYQSMLST